MKTNYHELWGLRFFIHSQPFFHLNWHVAFSCDLLSWESNDNPFEGMPKKVRQVFVSLTSNFGYKVFKASIIFGYIWRNLGYFGVFCRFFFQVYWYSTIPPGRPWPGAILWLLVILICRSSILTAFCKRGWNVHFFNLSSLGESWKSNNK